MKPTLARLAEEESEHLYWAFLRRFSDKCALGMQPEQRRQTFSTCFKDMNMQHRRDLYSRTPLWVMVCQTVLAHDVHLVSTSEVLDFQKQRIL
ncbi:hypothetical protein Y032_0080g1323 [Ancylostoma ceylanicum]|uniref:Uncharacterized protein n=1 Tax=Ancylostoma ceylanicum TaxID=53326 RepID=A0A016TRN0_9BILA|nr:hypothetical protein Y032_0080g1323 [Ancylostoma ceylanicum]